jgi:hypothetical protein
MKLRRRQILHLAASAAILPVTSRFAWAENYPARPVHLIVGFFAGGLTDILSRILAERFAGRFGQQFIVENVAGAGHKYRDRAGREVAPRRLYVTNGHILECDQRNALRSSQF